jgi:uncharacterized Zn finger protein
LRWWAQRWVHILGSLGPEYAGRLQQARSYARSGHVWRASVRPGHISAQVLGSYGYYTSAIKVPVLPDSVWMRALKPLGARPALLANLLADDFPFELEMIINEAGGSLFYDDPSLLKFSCSCPHYQRPCKHALALGYDFATMLDANPALLLTLAGHTVDELMTAIQQRWDEEQNRSSPGDKAQEQEARALRVAGFYSVGDTLDHLSIPLDLPQVNAALLYQLGKPPFASDKEDPITPLARFYAAMTEQVEQVLAKTRNSRAQHLTRITDAPGTVSGDLDEQSGKE